MPIVSPQHTREGPESGARPTEAIIAEVRNSSFRRRSLDDGERRVRDAPSNGRLVSARLPAHRQLRGTVAHCARPYVRRLVEPLVCTEAAMARSATPAASASRICIRFSRRAGSLPPLTPAPSSSRSAWLRSTRYRTFSPNALRCGSASDESAMNQLLDQETPAKRHGSAPNRVSTSPSYGPMRRSTAALRRRRTSSATSGSPHRQSTRCSRPSTSWA
jgi:hypothetical protein